MAIRGRVGRHVKTNKHCQNWKADQEVVTSLLNKIPVSDGGAEGLLNAPIVAGYASQQLFTSILYFQKKHFSESPTRLHAIVSSTEKTIRARALGSALARN